jgi:hypothetical protein
MLDVIILSLLGFGAYLLIGGATYDLSRSRFGKYEFGKYEDDEHLICAIFWPIYLLYLVFCVAALFMIAIIFKLISRLIRKALRGGGSVNIVK